VAIASPGAPAAEPDELDDAQLEAALDLALAVIDALDGELTGSR
jgi:hypothetical protein